MNVTITKRQMARFIKMRNSSDFQSNLQFQIDAEACGFRPSDLGDVKKIEEGEYVWQTPYGTLREKYGKMSLDPPY